MNTYIVCSQTNYDLMVHVVNADSCQEAKEIARHHPECGAWDNCEAHQICTEQHGVVFYE